MKRALVSLLALPLLGVVGCSEDAAVKPAASFTSSYDLGTYVVMEGTELTTTKTFVDLDGTVTQVDNLAPDANTTATGGVCRTRDDQRQTEMATEVSATSKLRIAGLQKAWLLPGSYGTTPADGAVNMWGDPANGLIFLNKPNLDTSVIAQLGGVGGLGSGQQIPVREYYETIPVGLFIFEEDLESQSTVSGSTTTVVGGTTTVVETTNIDDTSTGGQRRQLNSFTRFKLDNHVWQTNNLNNLYTGSPVAYGATLVVPDSVQVGDTWLDNNGNLIGAVGVDAVEVDGKSYRALHVIERGSTDVVLNAEGVAGWCVNFYTDFEDGTNVGLDSELTDLCDSRGGSTIGADGVNGVGSGWVNSRHIWYYRGLPIKIVEESVDIHLDQWGYTIGNDGTHGGADAGTVQGDCARYYETIPNVAKADVGMYKPYAIYDVIKMNKTYVATEIRSDYTLAKETAEEAEKALQVAE